MKIDKLKLETIMAEKGFQIKDLSEKTGIHEATISKIKNGIQKPRPITIGKIAKGLDVYITELIEQEN